MAGTKTGDSVFLRGQDHEVKCATVEPSAVTGADFTAKCQVGQERAECQATVDAAVLRELQADTKQFTRFVDSFGVRNMPDCKTASECPFVCIDHRHQHTFMHLPPQDASTAMHTYLLQKVHAPHTTSCCILVPAWKKANYSRLLKGMTLLKQYDKGAPIFRTTNGLQQCSPYAVRIYHDAAWPQPSRCNLVDSASAASMQFTGHVRGKPVVVRFDTGSDACFISQGICRALQLPTEPLAQPLNVQLAGEGHCLSATATCHASVALASACYMVRCYVMKLPPQHELILGEDFMRMAKTHLDYAEGTCTLKQGKKSICLKCSDPIAEPPVQHAPASAPKGNVSLGTITVAKLRRAYDKGCRVFAVQILPTDDSLNAQLQAGPYLGATSCSPDVHSSAPAVLQAGLKDVLQEFADCFPDELPAGLPPVRNVGHTVPLHAGTGAICRPMFRYSPAELAEIKRQLADLVAKGHVEPSSSPFGAPVLFVQKKDGGLRMCVDYRALNQVTVANRYPLPRIDEMLDQLHGAKYFSSLDLQSGYHQIRIDPADVEKTAFRTPYGLFQFKVLSFGLTNAPATFQRVMNDTFRQELGVFVLVYLDDILVFSRTPAEHLQHLRCVLSKLRQHSLYAKLSKCHFGRTELPFLGHIISGNGVQVDPKKTEVVKNWPTPTCMEDVRRFLGLAGYFRKFLQDYASKVACLTDLLKRTQPWAWTPHCEIAFQWVKDALQKAPVLALPDFQQPFEVICDASRVGIGAILLQANRPVAYESRKLKDAETRYTTGEQELLAVVHALGVFRCYLEGGPHVVKVITDHKPLTFLPTKARLSDRQARWQLFLSRFHIEWQHRSGRLNVADPLSRHPAYAAGAGHSDLPGPPMVPATSSVMVADCCLPPPPVRGVLPVDHRGLRDLRGGAVAGAVLPDVGASTVLSHGVGIDAGAVLHPAVASSVPSPGVDDFLRGVEAGYQSDPWLQDASNAAQLTRHDQFWRNPKSDSAPLYIPDVGDLRLQCLKEMHDLPYSGHVGVHKTRELLARAYWWPSWSKDVHEYVRTCSSCQRNKASNAKRAGPLQPLPIPDAPWMSVGIDWITHLPATPRGHTSIMVCVDRLSKMVHLIATKDSSGAEDAARLFFDNVVRLHGVPKTVISDRDARFTSHFWGALCDHLGVGRSMSTAFHPETDGQTERCNRILQDMLRHYINPMHNDWDEHLTAVEFAINNSFQESIKMSPFMLIYGQNPLTPSTLRVSKVDNPKALQVSTTLLERVAAAKLALAAAQQRQKAYADQKRGDVEFQVHQEVLLSTRNIHLKGPGSPKFMPKWIGPFTVVKRIGKTAYELELPANMKVHDVFHASLLKPYHKDGRVQPPPPELMVDGQEEFEVELILDRRLQKSGKKTKKYYCVKWRGYGHEHNTWEPEDNLSHCQEKIQVYEQQREEREVQETAATPTPKAQEEPSTTIQRARNQRGRGAIKKGTRKSKRDGRPTKKR